MTGQTPENWYPDPYRRYQFRYWDGVQWTHHVSTQGRDGIDPPEVVTPPPPVSRQSRRVQRQVWGYAGPAGDHGARLLTEPILVVNQKARPFRGTAQYSVFDQYGEQLGAVREVGSPFMRKATGRGGEEGTHKFQIVDQAGTVLISLHRPAKIIRSKMIVLAANGIRGEIMQKTLGVIGNVRFDLESGGRLVGAIHTESRAAWDFSIQDPDGSEVARITKTWAGWARERFTKADNYVVQIHRPLQEPLRSLVIAAALAIDTALKQDDNWRRRRAR